MRQDAESRCEGIIWLGPSGQDRPLIGRCTRSAKTGMDYCASHQKHATQQTLTRELLAPAWYMQYGDLAPLAPQTKRIARGSGSTLPRNPLPPRGASESPASSGDSRSDAQTRRAPTPEEAQRHLRNQVRRLLVPFKGE